MRALITRGDGPRRVECLRNRPRCCRARGDGAERPVAVLAVRKGSGARRGGGQRRRQGLRAGRPITGPVPEHRDPREKQDPLVAVLDARGGLRGFVQGREHGLPVLVGACPYRPASLDSCSRERNTDGRMEAGSRGRRKGAIAARRGRCATEWRHAGYLRGIAVTRFDTHRRRRRQCIDVAGCFFRVTRGFRASNRWQVFPARQATTRAPMSAA